MFLIDLFEKNRMVSTPVQYLQQYKNLPNIFVHFTNVEKIGVNPQSEHNTPAGVYAYPLEYVLKHDAVSELPYGGRSKYFYVIQATKPLLNLQKYTMAQFNIDLQKIIKWARDYNYSMDNELSELRPDHEEDETSEEYDELLEKYISDNQFMDLKISRIKQNASVETPGGYLWRALYVICVDKPALYTKILRYLGYDSVVDYGKGIIHPNEPTQAIFLIPNSFKILAMKNNEEGASGKRRQTIYPAFKMAMYEPEQFYINFVKNNGHTLKSLVDNLDKFDEFGEDIPANYVANKLSSCISLLTLLKKYKEQKLIDEIVSRELNNQNNPKYAQYEDLISKKLLYKFIKEGIDNIQYDQFALLKYQPEKLQLYFINFIIKLARDDMIIDSKAVVRKMFNKILHLTPKLTQYIETELKKYKEAS